MQAGFLVRGLMLTSALVLGACLNDGIDRFANGNESGYIPPEPDQRGVMTFESYQIAVAETGDTVRKMSDRFGQSVDAMSKLNGIAPDVQLRAGEVIVLPTGVDGAAIIDGRVVAGGAPVRRPGSVDIETIAADAIQSAEGTEPAEPVRPTDEPFRHRVQDSCC